MLLIHWQWWSTRCLVVYSSVPHCWLLTYVIHISTTSGTNSRRISNSAPTGREKAKSVFIKSQLTMRRSSRLLLSTSCAATDISCALGPQRQSHHTLLVVDSWDRQTDGRTPYHYIDPAYTMSAASTMCGCDTNHTWRELQWGWSDISISQSHCRQLTVGETMSPGQNIHTTLASVSLTVCQMDTTHTHLTALFRNYPSEPVPER